MNAMRAQGLWVFAILVFAVIHTSWGQEPSLPTTVEQWGMEEIALHSETPHRNSFLDVRLEAIFHCTDKTLRVSGFYDGDQTWKIRLMPESQGHCTFRTESNDPRLDGKSGSFDVGAPNAGNHGPVKVAKTYHFSYADGTPFFLLGTTLYNWLNRDPALEKRTLKTLAENPFNKIRFALFPKWMQYNRIDPPVYPYIELAEHKFDLDRFDPRFFHHIEERLRDLQKLGIEADVILFHPYDNWGFPRMDAAHDDAYIRYVAARLSAFRNVWWTMANEYNFFELNIPGIGLGVHKDWDRMFQVLTASDPYGHLRGMHNAGLWYDPHKPWITHVIAQETVRLPQLTSRGLQAYGKPVVIDEYGYEGNVGDDWGNLTAEEELNRHWQITMAGGYASHGETYVHPEGLLWWAVGGELVGDSPARLGFLKQVMTEGPFQTLHPAPKFVTGGTALASTGEYYLFRFSKLAAKPAQIEIKGSGPFKVELIDPWQMKIYPLGYTNAGVQAFTPVFVPSLLRFTKDGRGETTDHTENLANLLAKFIDDTTNPAVAKPRISPTSGTP